MNITTDFLREKGACEEGIEAFKKKFGKEGEYQAVLDALAESQSLSWAQWLIKVVGETNAILKITGDLVAKSIFFPGTVRVSGKIQVTYLIAGWGIEAGWGIDAGEGIEAGGGIEAGIDYGIYAGLSIRISNRKKFALIKARSKPANIVLGEYQAPSDQGVEKLNT